MKGLKILVVDDDAMMLELLLRMVRRMGHSTEAVGTSVEAVNRLQEEDFDVVITDLHLDDMTGLEVIHLVKPLRPYTVPVIMTGYGSRDETLAALKEGVFDFIEKPVPNREFLEAVIERAGHRSKLLRERDQLVESLRQKSWKQAEHIKQLRRAYARLREYESERDADLLRAQRIQQNMLPPGFPAGRGFDYFACFFPCELLGGDFFDVVALDGDEVALLLADVAGHGVGAAMLTVMIRQLIHARLLEKGRRALLQKPAQVMAYLNDGLFEQRFDDPHHVTIIYIVLDTGTGAVRLANAGHTSPLILGADGSTRCLNVAGPGLGIARGGSFEELEDRLRTGERMFVHSDGLADGLKGGGTIDESETSIRHRLESMAGATRDSREFGLGLVGDVRRSANDRAPEDDVSFFVFGPVDRDVGVTGELIPGSVEILHLGASRRTAVSLDQPIASGCRHDIQLIHLQGRCTWKHAHSVARLLSNPQIRLHYLNLADCESLDSTLLGTLVGHADHLVACSPDEKVLGQFEELGIRDLIRISRSPAPDIPIAVPREGRADFASDTELVYRAHCSLIRANPQNDHRFGSVVAELEKELASLREGDGHS